MLYLASRSPRRRELLRKWGRAFRVVPSSYHEADPVHLTPSAYVMRHAIGKVREVKLPRRARGVVIGADTIVYFQQRVIGKPQSLRHARQLMRALSGRSHWVYTGICLIDIATQSKRTCFEKTRVTFHPLTEETIDGLFKRAKPLDKAGGYALQADRGELIASIEGSRTNVIGLPMELLKRELQTLRAQHA